MKIDHLKVDEILPDDGLRMPTPDPAWTWVVRGDSDEIVAYLIALHGHGMVIPIRLHRLRQVPPLWVLTLLRAAARECSERGNLMYAIWLGDETREQREMRKIAGELGAVVIPMKGDIVSGILTCLQH